MFKIGQHYTEHKQYLSIAKKLTEC